MVGRDEKDGIAPGQGWRDRGWLQRAGAGAEGSPARGHLDPGLAEAQEARCLPSRLNSLGSRGLRLWSGADRVEGEKREPG